jgi:hypothetical protein
LFKEEQDQLLAKERESFQKSGGKTLAFAESVWSNEKWQFFGVNEFSDLDALQAHTARLIEIEWFRYVDSKVILGKEYVEP